MTADAAVAAELIRAQARRLRLPGLSKSFEPLARQARQGNWPPEEYLREALAAEELSRNELSRAQPHSGCALSRGQDAGPL